MAKFGSGAKAAGGPRPPSLEAVAKRRAATRRMAFGSLSKGKPKAKAPMPSLEVQELESVYLLGTYAGARPKGIAFVKGEGCKLFDAEGKEYLDFTSGIAVNCLGHSDAEWTSAVSGQLEVRRPFPFHATLRIRRF